MALILTAPFLDEVVHRSELLTDTVRISTGLINLVDGKDHGHASCSSVVDGFLSLWHHIVVSSDDDNGDVGHLSPTSTHSGEGFVPWSVEEGNALAILEAEAISTDVLGNPPGFACDDVGIAQTVEERSLTVVDVTHDGDDRRTGHEVSLVIDLFVLRHSFDDLGTDEVGLIAELFSHHLNGLSIETHIDGYHQTNAHTGSDDLRHGDIHQACQVADRDELGELERAAFSFATLLSIESC